MEQLVHPDSQGTAVRQQGGFTEGGWEAPAGRLEFRPHGGESGNVGWPLWGAHPVTGAWGPRPTVAQLPRSSSCRPGTGEVLEVGGPELSGPTFVSEGHQSHGSRKDLSR